MIELIISFVVGFCAGMYITTQISNDIDKLSK